ncbi:MAG: ABC transporter permease [Clostridia bacterium]|nr:ABC transporter permease [Clostridia bacterium]
MFAIFQKEMRSYFISAVGYVYTGIFLAVAALVCCYTTLLSQSYNTSAYFVALIVAFIVLLPLLTMKLFAEEKKLRTEQLLLTAPVKITSMVLGKFFAALTMFAGTTLLSCLNFLPLYIYGAEERAASDYESLHIGPPTAQIIGCIIGVFLIGAAFLAIGLFISSLCENQLSAAIITITILLVTVLLFFINTQELIDNAVVRNIIDWFSILSRFQYFSAGMFDISALIYYLSITFVFLFLTVRVYEKRRWG